MNLDVSANEYNGTMVSIGRERGKFKGTETDAVRV